MSGIFSTIEIFSSCPIFETLGVPLFLPMTDDGVPRLKVVVLGNSGCGKTSLIQRWISEKIRSDHPLIGFL
jgi:GTPase SAR1 family protein